MKKILFLGGGFLQHFAIKKAKELGYYTLVLDYDPYAVGFDYADKYEVINITDKESCLNYARKNGIDGVITVATDYGVLTASYISKELNIPGLDYESAQVVKNKYLTRKILNANNVDDIKQFYVISNKKELNRIASKIQFPVIVKPVDGSGSKGIQRVDNIENLQEATKKALSSSLSHKVLIEDFIVGDEYGVESIVINGKVYILGILEKIMTQPPYYAELGHSISEKLIFEKKLKKIVEDSIKLLNINIGAVNMDILVTDTGEVSIIDVGARMGGNLIGSHIIPSSIGYDYLGNLIKLAVNDEVEIPKIKKSNFVSSRLLALNPGKIIELPDISKISNDYNVSVFFNKKIGDEINVYKNNLDNCGYVLSMGEDSQKVKINVQQAKEAIDNNIIRFE